MSSLWRSCVCCISSPICIFLFVNGVPAIKDRFFDFMLGRNWAPMDTPASYGIFPMILGSIYVTAGAIIIGVPLGILTAIYLAKFCPKWLYKFLSRMRFAGRNPSVVYGFFGLVVLVPMTRNIFGGTGSSIFTASILLGIMILPTIIA